MAGRTMPMGDKTQRYVFFLGLLLAAIAAVIVFVAVSSSESDGVTSGGNVPAVVASQDIPAQTRITSDMLKVDFVAPDQAQADVFTSRSQLVDRVVTEEIAAGAQIVPTMVSDTKGDSLTFKLEPGSRAISVEVQEVVTAGGNVKPGDRVDLVGIFSVKDVESANFILQVLGLDYTLTEPPRPAPAPAAQDGEETAAEEEDLVLTITMLQNVKVLGLDQTLTPDTAGGDLAGDAEEVDTEPEAATATLELTPQQAQEITWADEFGVIRMASRAVGDDEIVDVVPTLFALDKTR